MTDIQTILHKLCRPRLLIRAARFGLHGYCRERDLSRMLRRDRLPSPGGAVHSLVDVESEMEDKRKSGDATYSIARHVEILIALMAESQLLRVHREV